MKKIQIVLTVLCACGIFLFAQNAVSQNYAMKNKKVLVAYFSRTGENYNVGKISKGNTHIIAEMIAEETDGKLFQIEPVNPYPDEYNACVEVAKTEKENKSRPAKEMLSWRSMTSFISAIPIGGEICRCQSTLSLRSMIGRERRLSRFAPTKAAVCRIRKTK